MPEKANYILYLTALFSSMTLTYMYIFVIYAIYLPCTWCRITGTIAQARRIARLKLTEVFDNEQREVLDFFGISDGGSS